MPSGFILICCYIYFLELKHERKIYILHYLNAGLKMALENEEVKEKAEFNMAVSYLNRLNSLFYAADEAAIHLDIYSWFHVLTAIYREISTEMTDPEIKICDAEIGDMNNIVMKQIQNMQRMGRNQIDSASYMKLHNFEMKMRNIMKRSGLQMKSMSDASKSLFES